MIKKYYLNIKNARLIIKNVLYDDLCSNLNIENVDWLTLRFRNGEKETERKTTWNFAEVFFDCFFSHIRRWRGYNLSNNIIECHLKNYLLYDILWFALDFIQVSQTFLLVSNRKKVSVSLHFYMLQIQRKISIYVFMNIFGFSGVKSLSQDDNINRMK